MDEKILVVDSMVSANQAYEFQKNPAKPWIKAKLALPNMLK